LAYVSGRVLIAEVSYVFSFLVPPNAPQVEFNGTQVPMGKNLTTQGGTRASAKCISRYGNPPPFLKWFVGKNDDFFLVFLF